MNYNEQLKETLFILEKLKVGIDPISGLRIDERSIINNVRISRALYFATEVLNNYTKLPKQKKETFYINREELELLILDEKKRTISEIAAFINDKILKEFDERKLLNQKRIAEWLLNENFLEEVKENGKNSKRPTEDGENIGIETEIRNGMYGSYKVNIYNIEAQQFVLDHIDCYAEVR